MIQDPELKDTDNTQKLQTYGETKHGVYRPETIEEYQEWYKLWYPKNVKGKARDKWYYDTGMLNKGMYEFDNIVDGLTDESHPKYPEYTKELDKSYSFDDNDSYETWYKHYLESQEWRGFGAKLSDASKQAACIVKGGDSCPSH